MSVYKSRKLNGRQKIYASDQDRIVEVLLSFRKDVMEEIMKLRRMFESVYSQALVSKQLSPENDCLEVDVQEKTFQQKPSLCDKLLTKERSLRKEMDEPGFSASDQLCYFSNSGHETIINTLNPEDQPERAETSPLMMSQPNAFPNLAGVESLSSKSMFLEFSADRTCNKRPTSENLEEFIKHEIPESSYPPILDCSKECLNTLSNENEEFFMNDELAQVDTVCGKLDPTAVVDQAKKFDSFEQKQQISNYTRKRSFQCEACHKTFKNKYILKRHMKIHTANYRHKCTYCNRSFLEKYNLISHLKTHTGEKPFKCTCGRSFSRVYNLKLHATRHSGKKPYKCEYCNKSFSHEAFLKCHYKTHGTSSTFSSLLEGDVS